MTVDADEAVQYGEDHGWDVEWAGMTPEQIVAEMRRVCPPAVLADAFLFNDLLYRLWAQCRAERLKSDSRDPNGR